MKKTKKDVLEILKQNAIEDSQLDYLEEFTPTLSENIFEFIVFTLDFMCEIGLIDKGYEIAFGYFKFTNSNTGEEVEIDIDGTDSTIKELYQHFNVNGHSNVDYDSITREALKYGVIYNGVDSGFGGVGYFKNVSLKTLKSLKNSDYAFNVIDVP